MEIIQKVIDSQIRKDIPDFRVGDTVDVAVRIVEGEKERIQVFTGVVTGRRGAGMGEMFTVRRIVNNEGVERTYPVNNPRIASIKVVRSGKVRRAKLFFLRKRVGKATRLKEIRTLRAGKGPKVVAVPGETLPAEAAPKE